MHQGADVHMDKKQWRHSNKRWFQMESPYTLIAALDVNGFVLSTCETFEHLNNSMDVEGASSTVDSEFFLIWVKEFLCPVLGSYNHGKPRFIVVMDNASTHMSWEVYDAIKEAGAYLLYTAPYSPDLNPIERAFNVYKAALKRDEIAFMNDPYTVHLQALQSISRDFSIGEFRRCGIPLSASPNLLTVEECKIKFVTVYLFVSLLLINLNNNQNNRISDNCVLTKRPTFLASSFGVMLGIVALKANRSFDKAPITKLNI